MTKNLRIAIVHDYLVERGGAERVVMLLCKAFPQADIYTSVFHPARTFSYFATRKIHYSRFLNFLQKIFGNRERIFPFIFLYFRLLNLRRYDAVISSSSAFALQVSHPRHYCYCHTPGRFIWRTSDYACVSWRKCLLRLLSSCMRPLDRLAARKVTCFIANSENVRQRIQTFYKRDAVVIHPAINCTDFQPSEKKGEYFLIVSRLKKYKNIELAVRFFNTLRLPLYIAGLGSEYRHLKTLARDNIRLLGKVTDKQLRKLYAECRALVFPGEEDFGITPLEAQSCGRPVIGLGAGGLLETVINGKTGIFFDQPTIASMGKAMKIFLEKESTFQPEKIRAHAQKFDEQIFIKKMQDLVNSSEI